MYRIAGPHRIQNHIKGTEFFQGFNTVATHHPAPGTQPDAIIQPLGRTDTDPAVNAQRLAQLNGRRTHTTGTGMDQHLVTRPGFTQQKHVEPGGGIYFWHRCCRYHIQSGRQRQDVAGIDTDLFSHTATGQQRTDRIARLPAGVAVSFHNFTGTLQPQHIRHTWRRRVKSGHLQQVGPVDACCRHPDTNLSRQPLRTLGIDCLWLPFTALQCFHSASIVTL